MKCPNCNAVEVTEITNGNITKTSECNFCMLTKALSPFANFPKDITRLEDSIRVLSALIKELSEQLKTRR
jgi:hypothetical protein